MRIGIQSMIFFGCLSILAQVPAHAGPVQRPTVAKEAEIVAVQGDGWIQFVREKGWVDAVREQTLASGDFIRTGNYGRMSLLFIDDSQIKIHNRTTLLIKEVRKPGDKAGTVLRLESGEVWSRAKSAPESLRIETPSATAAIRGTEWDIVVDEKGTSYLTVLRGSVEIYNDFGRVMVNPGEQATTEIGKPPVKTSLVRPKDRVQWVVSYPANIAGLVRFHPYRRDDLLRLLPPARERVKESPSDVEAKLNLAGLIFDLGEGEESLRLFDAVLASDPANCRALTFRGLLALDRGETAEAASYLDRALKNRREEEKRDASLGLVGVYLKRNEIEKAEALLKEIGERDPSALVGVVTSVFWAYLGNFARALEISSEYASKYPEDERFPTLLSTLCLALDERERGRGYAEKALLINPRFSQAYSALAEFYYLEGRRKDAEEACRKAIELDPRNAGARNRLGLIEMELGYFEESREQLSKAVEALPNSSMVWSNRGFLFTLIEKLEKAQADYGKALEIDPVNYLALEGKGLVALKEGRTEEAVQYFLKSSLLEPRFAQPHIFLSVAFYQLGDISHALDELRLAEALDPLDPTPHIVAYIINQDIYRPFEAVHEAKKALELLPYLKSMDEIENTRAGLSNLGTALLGLRMTEWAESYAQESYDPHNASSHFQAARQYNDNHTVSVSELIQGLILDPLANSSATRYQDIIRKPRHNLTASATLGFDGSSLAQLYSALAQGYFRMPWEISYSLAAQGNDSDGAVENGFSRGYSLAYGMGIKPDYQNSFNVGFSTGKSNTGLATKADPDPDDTIEFRSYSLDLGYRHRFGPWNDLLARVAYNYFQSNFKNSDPFGTGLTDFQISFLNAGFGTDVTRAFFKKGVYDVTSIIGGPDVSLATDSTGTLATLPGAVKLPSSFPRLIDTNLTYQDKITQDTLLFQARHLVRIADNHEFTYGLEYIPFRLNERTTYNRIDSIGTIDFFKEPFLTLTTYTFPLVKATTVTEEIKTSGRFITAYVDDRWKLSSSLLIEGGLFFESFQDENNNRSQVYPRIAAALKLFEKHVLRAGYLRWLDKITFGTLAPVTTAGLVIDNSLALQGSTLTDYQVRLESRWTDRLFTVIGVERVDLTDPNLGPGYQRRELTTKSLMAALNSILSKEIGVFLRYRYTDSQATGGYFDGKTAPWVPKNFVNGGMIWVSPLYVKVLAFANYVGSQYENFSNTRKISDYWTANLAATWEPFNKRVLFSFAVNNLFNSGAPAPARSFFFTLEYRL